MTIANKIENTIKETVQKTLINQVLPELPKEYAFTDNLGEVIEKLCILHIRTWFL